MFYRISTYFYFYFIVLNKTENVDVLFDRLSFDRLSFIKSHSPLDTDIVDLYVKDNLIPESWGRNIIVIT